mgnify:CR=1 FL=1
MALPQLSEEQRAANLKKAAEARHARAELREKIKNGQVTLEYVLDSDDPAATRMPVRALIESLPGYGKAKAAKIMDELEISPKRRVQGLGLRQREAVAGGEVGRTRGAGARDVLGRLHQCPRPAGGACPQGRCRRTETENPFALRGFCGLRADQSLDLGDVLHAARPGARKDRAAWPP